MRFWFLVLLPLAFLLLLFLATCTDEPMPEREGDAPGECGDDADNDWNGLFDCDDPGCAGAPSCSEDDDTGGDDDTGDDDSAHGDDDDDSAEPEPEDDCTDPGYNSSDPCCDAMNPVPTPTQCTNSAARASLCAVNAECCDKAWDFCCVAEYSDDFGGACS